MDRQQLLIGMIASLSVTVVILAVAMVLAHKHKVKAHIGAICAFLVTLLVTIVFAELLGRKYSFSEPSFTIHLSLAFATSAMLLVPLGTGIQHYRGQATKKTHKRFVGVWLVLLVSALLTGIWMLVEGTPKELAKTPGTQATGQGD